MKYRLAAACVALALNLVAGQARAERVTLRLGTLAVEDSRYMKDIRAMSAEIEKRTGGKVRLKWYPDGRLGDEPAMVDLIAEGRLDGGGFSDVGLAKLVPQMRAWQYPGLFDDYDQVDRATASLGDELGELFSDADVVFAMWADLGFAHVFSSDKIARWDDLLADTLWFDSGDDALVSATELLGGSARIAPGDGLFSAIIAGYAARWAMPPLYALAGSVHGHAGYLWQLRYRYVVGGLVIHSSAWARLTERQQKQFLAVCAEWEPKIRKRWRAESKRAVHAIRDSGVKLVGASDADEKALRKASDEHRAAFAERWELADWLERIAAARGDDN